MPEQLTFDLPARPALGRGDFFVSRANALAVARLDTPADWPGGQLALVGPAGAGKSHLAQVWAAANDARLIPGEALSEIAVAEVEAPVVIDDADRLPRTSEETLFHLYNHLGHRGLPLLLTSRHPPARWPIRLPDLQSRMAATDIVRIDPPDDSLLAAMLVKLFRDRQLAVPPNLIPWLVTHGERSFAAVQNLVAAIDAASLRAQRPVTRALAREVLDNLTEDGRQSPS